LGHKSVTREVPVTKIRIPEAEIADFCRRHGIQRLELFGSVLRDDFGPESDVDLMVEFEPGRTPGLRFFTLAEEHGGILGRKVDLLTRRSVEDSPNYIFRKHALERTEILYDAAA
jgi:predicted nucleotidyltransferase